MIWLTIPKDNCAFSTRSFTYPNNPQYLKNEARYGKVAKANL